MDSCRVQHPHRHLKAQEGGSIRERRTGKVSEVSRRKFSELSPLSVDPSNTTNVPNKRRGQPPRERLHTFRPPSRPHTIPRRLVLFPGGGRKSIRLHTRLDHIYRVYDCPKLRSMKEKRYRVKIPGGRKRVRGNRTVYPDAAPNRTVFTGLTWSRLIPFCVISRSISFSYVQK